MVPIGSIVECMLYVVHEFQHYVRMGGQKPMKI